MDFESVRLTDVTRRYGRRRAVSRVSLTLRSGDIVGLLGPNGAGKSTLLSMLATLSVPTSGTIAYGDASVGVDGAAVRRRIGVLAHELFLYSELSARQNLAFFAQLYGLEPSPVVSAALAAAGLSERADDQVASFSRGMRQRLALERALLHRPRLLLLDEPTVGVDIGARQAILDHVHRLCREDGLGVLWATHLIDEVNPGDDVVVLHQGRVLAHGDVEAVARAADAPNIRAAFTKLTGTGKP
jgi:ABC-2 type transport system ATP-binding protein